MTNDDRWLTSREAAQYLGYSNSTLVGARQTGKLAGKTQPKYAKVGRAVRYKKTNLDAWVRGEGGA